MSSPDHQAVSANPPAYNDNTPVQHEVVLNEKDGMDFDKENNAVTPDGGEPTDNEKRSLRHIAENLPISAWLVAIVELCERFTYYGMSGLFQNYVFRPLRNPDGTTPADPGALGMGHQGATGLVTFFQFWCYITPIIGAIVADQYLGKYKTIVLFCGVYLVGLLILVLTSLPTSLEHGAGLPGFIVSILIVGLGTGGIKSNVAPLIADQYKRKKMALKTIEKTGERVVIDPALTIQRIYMIFYGCINLGSLSLLATPYMEKYTGFWSAYLLCLCMFAMGTAVLLLGRKFYVVRPPQGSIITDAFKALWIMVKNRNMDAPKPSWQAEHHAGAQVSLPWDDHFIDELKRALVACRVFAFYPIYWVVYGQFSGNFVTQAAQMNGHGIPNDLMQNFDPISIIVFIPILETAIYPVMRRLKIPFRPITRIALGFAVAALAMMYAAIVQHLIYSAGPCYGKPLCAAGPQGNDVHIAIQTPAYVFIGISEIFASVSGLEYAYTKAPPSMKSFVQSMYLLTNAFGSAIAEALTPAAFDPAIMWMFVGLACASFLCGILFFLTFRHLNYQEDDMNALDADDPLPDEDHPRRGNEPHDH
ncbi:Proton-dependent oligopeptide transporter family protein [Penicillium ucsense]|uniref:Proton-dependent oligopeptide transporter family protein n=1 Tax=Penicillium ucsense TaxID=2839758 RepID=A0A8J8WGX5_9EURO|nr:Proton-dependent oligopeptide transporter family protein [Penicillium ucsense]KAF7736153.1 Proton-dependent oligopeptide transporter family protein [Penicillium ucsense]